VVDADLLKKLGIAPKNESYIINVIRFLGLIDDGGRKTDQASRAFTLHEDKAFQQAFAEIVKAAYKGLFEIYKEDAWTQPENKLISFFRQADQSSEIVGGRQASTFRSLAVYAGCNSDAAATQKPKSASPKPKGESTKSTRAQVKQKGSISPKNVESVTTDHTGNDHRVSLTVRVEVNLPAGADQNTYDRIFKSIRENLMNG
jgi:hypothetical protein